MTERIKHIRPVAGRIVPHVQDGKPIDETGCAVVWNAYWERRLAEGVIVIEAPVQVTEETPSPKPTTKKGG